MNKIINEIETERKYQIAKWGNDMDDRNTPFNWASYITNYATRDLIGDPANTDEAKFRISMVKVATLAVAAIEAIDRKGGN